jgi:hypothetical protein
LINKVKKMNSWEEKLLSMGGRLTLIKLVLNAIPIYCMSIYCLLVNIKKKRIEQLCKRFFWFRGHLVRKKNLLPSYLEISVHKL